jgi:hypothetical protein
MRVWSEATDSYRWAGGQGLAMRSDDSWRGYWQTHWPGPERA